MGQHKHNPVAIKAKAGELKPVQPSKPSFRDRICARLKAEAKKQMQSDQKSAVRSSGCKTTKKIRYKHV